MRKWNPRVLLIFLSYLGVGLMGNVVGAERRARKRSNDFYFKFTFQTIGWSLLLFVIPGILFWSVIHPNLTDKDTVKRVAEIIFALYVYFSGVFICWWQVRLLERDG